MNNSIYLKSFVFEASEYHEYRQGACTAQGKCDTTIVGKILSPDCIGVGILDDNPIGIKQRFGLPIFGRAAGDVLEDRIMYGRLPDNLDWNDPNEPVVCEVFNTLTRVRFAMLRPLRIVEFTGQITDIR